MPTDKWLNEIIKYKEIEIVNPTLLNRKLVRKASSIEASALLTTDFPFILLCCVVQTFDAPTSFSWCRMCEIILRVLVGVAKSSKNLNR